ncbi:MAG TPA: hypothetical protein VFG02_07645 [Nitrospirota bacterium]|nr:hypothetical protein [Nitrospirota bacterium]
MGTSILRYFLSSLVLALMLLPSCSPTTKLASVWKDDGFQNHPKKMMIIGELKNPGNRRIFEDEMVKQLKALRTDAVVSYAAIPERTGVDRDTITAKMNELGADAVLIARVVDKKTVSTYVPGTVRPGYPGYGGGWHGYYAYSQSYTVQDEFAVLQTNLYDLKADKLIWTAVSETWITENNESLIRSFTKVIIDRLVSDKMLATGAAK